MGRGKNSQSALGNISWSSSSEAGRGNTLKTHSHKTEELVLALGGCLASICLGSSPNGSLHGVSEWSCLAFLTA